jgi:predicted ATPase/DNA-binding winged helix-turn-helix (wHTH) protein
MPLTTEQHAAEGGADAIRFGAFRLIAARRLLLEGDRPVRLGGRAFDILHILIERAGQVVGNDELMKRAWPTTTIDEASVRINIAAIRRLLGDSQFGNRFIANVPGRGYTFVAPIVRENGGWEADAPTSATRGNAIPTSLSRIIGREDVIARIANRFNTGRLVTVVGPGGVGKTTIATAVASTVREAFPDGVWFVALAPLESPDLLPSALTTVFGISLSGLDPLSRLMAWLGEKRALIVLDNCEHVVGAVADLVEAIMTSTPYVAILATSREPLRVRGEWRHRLAPLGLPSRTDSLEAADALGFSAVQLFAERAAATVEDFAIDEDLRAVIQICRRLDGIPLALELAAPYVGVLGVRELAARLDDRLVLMIHGRRTALPRHQTLNATLDWSYNLLPMREQVVVRRLAIFHGSFSMEAAQAVLSDGGLTAAEVLEGIANLIDKSLIAADTGNEVAHYYLLETTRAYALERLRERDELNGLARAHAEYFQRLFQRAESDASRDSRTDHRTGDSILLHDCRAALDWAFSPNGDVGTAVRLTAALTPLWVRMSLMSECRRYCERALAEIVATNSHDASTEMVLRAALGASLTYTTGPGPETLAAWAGTLRLAERLGDTEYRLRALRGLWSYHMNAGEYRTALANAIAFRALAGQRANPVTSRAGARMVGLILHYLGDQEAAREQIAQDAGNLIDASPGQAPRFMIEQGVATRALLARILWLQGFPDQAMRTAESALAQAEAADHIISRCHALAQAALPVALWTGDLVKANQFATNLLSLASENLLDGWIARGKCFAGVLAIRDGHAAEGSAALDSALQELRRVGSRAEYPAFLASLAYGRARAGQPDIGLAAIDQAIEWCDRTEERWYAAELLRDKGEILLLSNPSDPSTAESAFQKSLEIARQQGALSWELRTTMSLARLSRDDGRHGEARGLLARVRARFSEGFGTADLRAAEILMDELA